MEYETTARVIATLKCNRQCDRCVNYQSGILDNARTLIDLSALRQYPVIAITGGEPTLWPSRLLALIASLREAVPAAKIYLYASDYVDVVSMRQIILAIDGLTYTIHRDSTSADIVQFDAVQSMMRYMGSFRTKSFRLTIIEGMLQTLYLSPWLWQRIDTRPFDDKCTLPDNEVLFQLDNDVWRGLTIDYKE